MPDEPTKHTAIKANTTIEYRRPIGDGKTCIEGKMRILRIWMGALGEPYFSRTCFVEYVCLTAPGTPPSTCTEEMLLRWLNNEDITPPAAILETND